MALTGRAAGGRAERRTTGGTDRAAERAQAERGKAVDAAILVDREAVRDRLDHEARRDSTRQQVDFIPTGSIALDLALGVGGIPRGRITEIFGPESSGKTTSASTSSPRPSGAAAWPRSSTSSTRSIRATPGPAASTSTSSSSASRTPASRRSRSPRPSSAPAASTVVVVDSVAALVPRAEIEGEMGDSFVGIQARLMSQALRKLTGAVSPLEHVARSSRTSSARRSGSCSATPRRRPAAGR